MLTRQRKNLILERLGGEGRIVAKDLAAELDLSEDTIRRDLRELARDGRLQRVHGGALPSAPAEADLVARTAIASDSKRAVGRTAAALIEPGQTVIVDGGTTALQLVAHLAPDLRATIVTHSPVVAVALERHPSVAVELVGGRLYRHSMVAVGAAAVEAMSTVRADAFFMGVTGIDAEAGLSTGDLEEAHVKRALSRRAAETIVLASAEKLGVALHLRRHGAGGRHRRGARRRGPEAVRHLDAARGAGRPPRSAVGRPPRPTSRPGPPRTLARTRPQDHHMTIAPRDFARRPPQVAVLGSADAGSAAHALAARAGALVAELGYTLVSGCGSEATRAAAENALAAGGQVISVVPHDDVGVADWPCTALVPCGMGDARNLVMALAGDACVVVGGRAGTISEVCLAWLHGRPLLPLAGCGGWSDRLEREPPDERRLSPILPWTSVDSLRARFGELGFPDR